MTHTNTTEYLVNINGHIQKICKHQADVINVCLLYSIDNSREHFNFIAMPLLPDGRVHDKSFIYEWYYCPTNLGFVLKSIGQQKNKPFADRKGSFVDFVID